MANVRRAQEREIQRKIGDLINAEGVADLIADIMEPGDLFREDQLRAWAEEHGYVADENYTAGQRKTGTSW